MGLLDQVSLEHVRLLGVGVDAPVARLRLSSLLASASLQPPAMPPSAVLVVRTMADPLPGRIIAELKPAAIARPEWEHAAQDRLGALYARAARPAWGVVPDAAEAVLFADYGELLACLAIDLNSAAGLAWWWQSLRKRFALGLPGSWIRLWEEHPEYVPSAVEHLAVRHRAASVMERIAPAQAWRLLLAVARAFALPGSAIPRSPVAAVDAPMESPLAAHSEASAPVSRGDPEPARERASAPSGAAPAVPLRPPWEPYVSPEETPPALGIERRALLGVALLLRRAPQVALTVRFSLALRAWLVAEQTFAPEGASDRTPSLEPRSAATAPSVAMTAPVRRTADPPVSRQPDRSTPLEPERTTATPAVPSGEVHQTLHRRPAATERRAEWDTGMSTRAGGVLYLIHLLRQADLMRHFDTGLGGWALLELLARCLLGASFNALAADPIWAALAELDGRDPRLPAGNGFEARTTYTAPESWLAGLAPQPLLARFRSRGVELWRPEGFLVLDSKDQRLPPGRPILPSTHFARRHRGVWPAQFSLSPELRRFLHFVLPYARWRLAAVLRGTSFAEVCIRRGRLVLSPSHVDLIMDMSQISVPLRLAGLDANPGWVPELGRVITFHFVPEGFGGG